MLQIMFNLFFILFVLSFCVFAGAMLFEPRTLWSGVFFFLAMMWLVLSVGSFFLQYAHWLGGHPAALAALAVLFVLAGVFVLAFPALLVLVFFVEGLKVIRKEGRKPANYLSLLFSILLCAYVFVWPMAGHLRANSISARFYTAISAFVLYLLALMAMYVLSAILNLSRRKRRRLDYIIVLGCAVRGKKVTPLLAARVDKGIQLMRYNPNAVLILSGGKGPGEEVAESEAMADYAILQGVEKSRIAMERESGSTQENLLFSARLMEKPGARVAIVTTSYHVFRALILARKQKLKCIGFGSRTKWYFTLNALIREFAGYLGITWKWHAAVAALLALPGILAAV